jgi:RNA polymerase sigma-70 factor (ECF subfamily)
MYKVVGLESTGPLSSDTGGPAEEVLPAGQRQMTGDALTKLPLPQREVVVLHLQGGMKFREIAEVQGVSINTVQSRYLYGLEQLRSLLNVELTE